MKYPDKGVLKCLLLMCAAAMLFAFKGCADAPDSSGELLAEAHRVHGRWSIDADASAEYARKSPRWTDEDEANVGTVLGMMSERYFLGFEPGAITIEERGNSVKIPLDLVQSSEGRHVYIGTFAGAEVEFTAVVNADGNLNLRTSISDDFDYILWKRAD